MQVRGCRTGRAVVARYWGQAGDGVTRCESRLACVRRRWLAALVVWLQGIDWSTFVSEFYATSPTYSQISKKKWCSAANGDAPDFGAWVEKSVTGLSGVKMALRKFKEVRVARAAAPTHDAHAMSPGPAPKRVSHTLLPRRSCAARGVAHRWWRSRSQRRGRRVTRSRVQRKVQRRRRRRPARTRRERRRRARAMIRTRVVRRSRRRRSRRLSSSTLNHRTPPPDARSRHRSTRAHQQTRLHATAARSRPQDTPSRHGSMRRNAPLTR